MSTMHYITARYECKNCVKKKISFSQKFNNSILSHLIWPLPLFFIIVQKACVAILISI